MMNRTLYALTLVTFLATPIILLTGTFGMNFSDMLELVRPHPTPITVCVPFRSAHPPYDPAQVTAPA